MPAGEDQSFNYTSDIVVGGGSCSLSTATAFALNDFSVDTQTCSDIPPDTYMVTETLPVSGFDLTLINCVTTGGTAGSTFTYTGNGGGNDFALGDDTANITLVAGGEVTCTYTNTALPDLEVAKVGVIQYTITVTNNGPGVTTTWQLTDMLPGSDGPNPIWSITSTVPAGITCNINDDNDLTCTTTTFELKRSLLRNYGAGDH